MPSRAGRPPYLTGNRAFSQQKIQVEGLIDPAGRDWIVMNDTVGAVNALSAQNNVTGQPVVLTVDGYQHDPNAGLLIAAPGTGTITIGQAGNTVAIIGANISQRGAGIFITNSANALAVGPTGAVNPVFNVDSSVSGVVTGLNVQGHAAAGGVDLSLIGGNALENLRLNAKGGGALFLNSTATGAVHAGHGLTVDADGLTITAGGLIVSAGGAQIVGMGAFVSGDKYVIVDASGNLHISALGPAS